MWNIVLSWWGEGVSSCFYPIQPVWPLTCSRTEHRGCCQEGDSPGQALSYGRVNQGERGLSHARPLCPTFL